MMEFKALLPSEEATPPLHSARMTFDNSRLPVAVLRKLGLSKPRMCTSWHGRFQLFKQRSSDLTMDVGCEQGIDHKYGPQVLSCSHEQ